MLRKKAYRNSDAAQPVPSSTTHRSNDPNRSKMYCIPSRFMSPVSFLSPNPEKKKNRYSFYYDSPSPSKLFKKYIGKKAVYVKKPKQMKSACHHLKLFQEIELNEGKCMKSSFRCLGDIVILGYDMALNKIQRRKIVSPYLQKIKLVENSNLNILRYTRYIKDLSLVLGEKQRPRVKNLVFKNLQSLEKFDLQMTKPSRNWNYTHSERFDGGQSYIEFFLELIQLRNLKLIHLDFSSYVMKTGFLINTVEFLEQVETYRWFLKAKVDRKAISDEIPRSGILNKIDFLGLDVGGNLNDEEYAHAPQKLSKMRQITDQKRKVLNLSFRAFDKEERFYLNELLNHCAALEGLYLRSLGESFMWVEDDKPINDGQFTFPKKKVYRRKKGQKYFTPEEIRQQKEDEKRYEEEFARVKKRLDEEKSRRKAIRENRIEEEKQKAAWACGLTDVILSYSRNRYSSRDHSGESFDTLLEVIKEKSRNLRSLNMFCCTSEIDYDIEKYGGIRGRNEKFGIYDSCSDSSHDDSGRFDSVYTMPEELNGMQSLESLELSSGHFQEGLGPMLLSMRNLKKFTFHLYAEKDTKPWDDRFLFEGLSQINEIRVVIHNDMKIVAWGKRFVKELAKLQELQVLEIIDMTKQEISLSAFSGLLNALCQLKKLRRVVLHTKVSKEKTYDEAEYLLSEDAQRLFEEGRRTIFDDINNRVKKLVEVNPNMENIEMKEIKAYGIGRIEYKKK